MTEDVRATSGTVWAASFRTPRNKAQRAGDGEFRFAEPMALLQKKTLLTKIKICRFGLDLPSKDQKADRHSTAYFVQCGSVGEWGCRTDENYSEVIENRRT